MSQFRRLYGVLVSLLGLAFVVAGGMKLQRPGAADALFESWGLDPTWTIPVAGWVEVVLGVLLFRARTRTVGAAALGVWMLAFGTLQMRAGQTAGALASVAVLSICIGAVLTRGPGRDSWSLAVPAPLLDPPATPGIGLLRIVELVGLAFLFRWAVGGTLYWLALPVLAWGHSRRVDPDAPLQRETILLYLLVLGLGVSGLWGFVGHTFMTGTVSASVGWDPSPFQQELAFYHLALGLAGLACWWIRDRFWIATASIATVFMFGAGWVHLRSYLETGNTAPANWGFSVLFGSVLLPTALLVLVILRERARAA